MHRLTSKRQVTVPRKVCEALGLAPGDYVEIFEREGAAEALNTALHQTDYVRQQIEFNLVLQQRTPHGNAQSGH